MTSEELKKAIFVEINERDMNNWHSIAKDNLDRLLVEPNIIELVDVLGQRNEYWLVLDEQPGDLVNGYQLVYDERKEMFGLATKNTVEKKDIGYLVGLYDSFVDTLDNM